MVGASSNIYVSLTANLKPEADGGELEHHRPKRIWMVSVEAHKHWMSLTSRHKIEPVHFVATTSEGEDSKTFQLQRHTTHGIIGTILIAEGTHGGAEEIQRVLAESLNSGDSSLPSEQAPDDEPDRWLRRGLRILQAHKLTDSFDVGEFMTFAHSYAAQRDDNQGPAMIAYPRVHKEPEKKHQKHGFWLSYPTESPNRGDPESRIYGGLM